MARVGWSMAALALVVTLLSSLIPLLGTFIIAPLATIIIGAGAGWWASKRLGSGGAGRGAGAGSIAGLGAFLGTTIGTVIIFSIMGGNQGFQQQFLTALQDAQQQNPGTELPPIDRETLASAAAVIGGGLGFCVGLFNIFLSMLGGLIAGAVYGKRDTPAVAPVGAYVPENTGIPQMTSQAPYTGQTHYGGPTDSSPQPDYTTRVMDPTANEEHNARIYPVDSDEHKTRIYPDDDKR